MPAIPKHKHDCENCTFLGNAILNLQNLDFYFCAGVYNSVIARFGDDGPEYYSIPASMIKSNLEDPIWRYANSHVENLMEQWAYERYAQ